MIVNNNHLIMKKNLILIILSILTSSFTLFSQETLETPVKWVFKTEKINDSIAELQFTATIKDKWHLYSQNHTGMEIPMSFVFKTSPNYKKLGKVLEPKPKVFYDTQFNDTTLYFDHKVTFKQKIQVLTNEPFEVKGEL
jgi:thiol:disulfide interchange protein DsbD